MTSIDDSACCEKAGCFKTAYGSRFCSDCLNDNLPQVRGRPTGFELLYAQAYGGEDLATTVNRLRPFERDMFRLSDETGSNEPQAVWSARECPVCSNDCGEGGTLCTGCRLNVHRD